MWSNAKLGQNEVVVPVWSEAPLPRQSRMAVVRIGCKGGKEVRVRSPAVFPQQRGANEIVRSLALSADERVLAAVSDGDVAILDMTSMGVLRRLGQAWGESAAFSPSAGRIALGTDGRGVVVWETKTGLFEVLPVV